MDTLTKEKRSWNMSRIKSKDTKPEMQVRSALHRAGYRFRLHVKDLPGKPDIVLPRYQTIIDVRGCFWHFHKNCGMSKIPSTNKNWWKEKLKNNVLRDTEHLHVWESEGWKVLVIWTCLFKHMTKTNNELILNYLFESFNMIIREQHKYLEISWNDFCNSKEFT